MSEKGLAAIHSAVSRVTRSVLGAYTYIGANNNKVQVLKRQKLAVFVLLILGVGGLFFAFPPTEAITPIVEYIASSKNFSLVSYLDDEAENFIVIEKAHSSFLTSDEGNDIEKLLKIVELDTEDKGKYNIHYIEGYDYDRLLENEKDILNENANSKTEIEKFDNYVKFLKGFQAFFDDLFGLLDDVKPSVPKINNKEHYANKIDVFGGHLRENYQDEPVRTSEMLSKYLQLSTTETMALKKSHHDFIEGMPTNYLSNLYKYPHFMKGDGIIYVAGGKYSELTLLSIKTLRDTGSRVPVEVFLPREFDFDVRFCSELLPKFDAKCVVMEEYVSKKYLNSIGGYQLKIVALLISSFERILYLDSDNLPMKNPDHLFVNEPFLSKNLVIWPDFWRRSTSPLFYDIAEKDVHIHNKVRNSYPPGDSKGTDHKIFSFHDCEGAIPEASSETGQLLVNKKVHTKSLILAMYYNEYGPDYFYPLLSQGAAGEGDKETFIAAAHNLGLSYYQVQEYTREFGRDNGRKHDIYAMGQYDPIIDNIQSSSLSGNKNVDSIDYLNHNTPPKYGKNKADSVSNYDFHLFKSSLLMFLHANWPKLLVKKLFDSGSRSVFVNNKVKRLYNYDLLKSLHGYDFELEVFQNLNWLYCELDIQTTSVARWSPEDRKNVCSKLHTVMEFLKTDKA